MFLEGASNLFLLDRKRNKMKVAEKYCWTIAQVVSESRCGRSRYSVFVFWVFNCTHFYTHTHIGTHVYIYVYK
jgi:hypothetical protein